MSGYGLLGVTDRTASPPAAPALPVSMTQSMAQAQAHAHAQAQAYEEPGVRELLERRINNLGSNAKVLEYLLAQVNMHPFGTGTHAARVFEKIIMVGVKLAEEGKS